MKTAGAKNIQRIGILALLVACVGAIGLHAQAQQASQGGSNLRRGEQPQQSRLTVPAHAQPAPMAAYRRYLESEEGRAMMQAAGRPISKYLNNKFGAPSADALAQARARWQKMAAQPQPLGTETAKKGSVPCNAAAGARFNLEPRPDAVPQLEPVADFILNGAGPGDDLIVQAANDTRGVYPIKTWNDSISGYYVHSSSTADCSVQFEGGLPDIGETNGSGFGAVAADPVRGAFFMLDSRFPAGLGLFRATTAALLNPKICPPGTHLEAQAESCWGQTTPVLLDANGEEPGIGNVAVDQRAIGSGAGGGDVYVVWNDAYDYIAACTNSLSQCSAPLSFGGDQSIYPGPTVQVRADGLITIVYRPEQNVGGSVSFIACTPAGAPNPPVCQPSTTAATIANPLPTAAYYPSQFLQNITNDDMFTYPKHVDRQESNGTFTTFVVYDDCKNPYTPSIPPNEAPTLCLSAEVNMTYSQDGGNTWSTPVSVNVADAHQFYPSIALDASTGTVSIAWYSTQGDPFFHDIRVYVAQVAPGSTTLGAAQPVTSFSTTDAYPDQPGSINDFNMGAVAHGTGTAGQSHLYLSFDSSAVDGTYNKEPLPEENNHIVLVTY
jgi:hypothetical protein